MMFDKEIISNILPMRRFEIIAYNLFDSMHKQGVSLDLILEYIYGMHREAAEEEIEEGDIAVREKALRIYYPPLFEKWKRMNDL